MYAETHRWTLAEFAIIRKVEEHWVDGVPQTEAPNAASLSSSFANQDIGLGNRLYSP